MIKVSTNDRAFTADLTLTGASRPPLPEGED